MTITAHLEDLADEGLDLLLRIALKTDARQVDDWHSLGKLIEEKNITVTHIKDSLWSAELPDSTSGESFESEFGNNPRVSIACTIIRAHFPDGPAFRVPKEKAVELFTEKFLGSPSWQLAIQLADLEPDEDGKISVHVNYP